MSYRPNYHYREQGESSTMGLIVFVGIIAVFCILCMRRPQAHDYYEGAPVTYDQFGKPVMMGQPAMMPPAMPVYGGYGYGGWGMGGATTTRASATRGTPGTIARCWTVRAAARRMSTATMGRARACPDGRAASAISRRAPPTARATVDATMASARVLRASRATRARRRRARTAALATDDATPR